MTEYHLWFHEGFQAVFAVRCQFGKVTGVCLLDWFAAVDRETDLAALPYDGREEAIARARDTPEQFVWFWPSLGGRYIPVDQDPWPSIWERIGDTAGLVWALFEALVRLPWERVAAVGARLCRGRGATRR